MIISILAAFFSVMYGFYYKDKSNTLEMKNNALSANNELLIRKVKKSYEDTLEISKRNAELEEMAKQDKDVFNWNTDISNSAIVQRLRKD